MTTMMSCTYGERQRGRPGEGIWVQWWRLLVVGEGNEGGGGGGATRGGAIFYLNIILVVLFGLFYANWVVCLADLLLSIHPKK
jgi:hypothetical protein